MTAATGTVPGDVAAPMEDIEAVAALLGRRVDEAQRVGAGRNSRVYRVRSGSNQYAAKFYFKPTADGRDRLEVEFSGLQFLWAQGLRCIAEPIKSDRARQVAIYGFVDGNSVEAAAASAQDVDQMLSFLRQLQAISRVPGARNIGPAAEAFFVPQGVVDNVGQRLQRLRSLDAKGPAYESLRAFLDREFLPAFQGFSKEARNFGNEELVWDYRTLSPSDLGFHNSLRDAAGRLVFLDFEYFGWDDPAKTLSDAVLHPLMRLAAERKRQIAAGFEALFGADPRWRERVEAVYPLFALKWCMIMLNEFRPEQIERRRYVDLKTEEVHVIQMRQLESARALLQAVTGAPGFPYWR